MRRLLLVVAPLADRLLHHCLTGDRRGDLVDRLAVQAVDLEPEIARQPLLLLRVGHGQLRPRFRRVAARLDPLRRELHGKLRRVLRGRVQLRERYFREERVGEGQRAPRHLVVVADVDLSVLATVLALQGILDPVVEPRRHPEADLERDVLVLHSREVLPDEVIGADLLAHEVGVDGSPGHPGDRPADLAVQGEHT